MLQYSYPTCLLPMLTSNVNIIFCLFVFEIVRNINDGLLGKENDGNNLGIISYFVDNWFVVTYYCFY